MVFVWLSAALPLAGLLGLLLLLWPAPQPGVQPMSERPLLCQNRWPAPPAGMQAVQPAAGRPIRKAGG